MNFKDHFSGQAGAYAKYRPAYPPGMFAHIAALAPAHEAVWDCATGNGQAARGLAPFFRRVIATDASANQIENAERHAQIEFRVAQAENSGLTANSVDVITAAQALHWFDLERFYAEARRVLKSNGLIVVWCYNLLETAPEIDAIVNRFYGETVGAYWPPERKIVEERYQTISFPFAELPFPDFSMRAKWSFAELVGYLRTWSASQAFIKARHFDPTLSIIPELAASWGDEERKRTIFWPLTVRAGRVVP